MTSIQVQCGHTGGRDQHHLSERPGPNGGGLHLGTQLPDFFWEYIIASPRATEKDGESQGFCKFVESQKPFLKLADQRWLLSDSI